MSNHAWSLFSPYKPFTSVHANIRTYSGFTYRQTIGLSFLIGGQPCTIVQFRPQDKTGGSAYSNVRARVRLAVIGSSPVSKHAPTPYKTKGIVRPVMVETVSFLSFVDGLNVHVSDSHDILINTHSKLSDLSEIGHR